MSSAPQGRAPLRGTRAILVVAGLAFVISVVHYLDNYANYADYPVPPADSAIPAPSDTVIALAWLLFTASGLLGVVSLLRGRVVPAVIGLAFYSVSGLIGIGHYTVPGALDMPWWRHAHVLADIAVGLTLLVLAGALFGRNRDRA